MLGPKVALYGLDKIKAKIESHSTGLYLEYSERQWAKIG